MAEFAFSPILTEENGRVLYDLDGRITQYSDILMDGMEPVRVNGKYVLLEGVTRNRDDMFMIWEEYQSQPITQGTKKRRSRSKSHKKCGRKKCRRVKKNKSSSKRVSNVRW